MDNANFLLSELSEKIISAFFHVYKALGFDLPEKVYENSVENKFIIELKSVEEIHSRHETQLTNYLRATAVEAGLVLNFGEKPGMKRRVSPMTVKHLLSKLTIPADQCQSFSS